MLIALLAGVLLLAPLVCGTHLSFHDQMGLSHGLCLSIITLAVGAAFTIPMLNLFFSVPLWAYALYAPLLNDPINKPPQ